MRGTFPVGHSDSHYWGNRHFHQWYQEKYLFGVVLQSCPMEYRQPRQSKKIFEPQAEKEEFADNPTQTPAWSMRGKRRGLRMVQMYGHLKNLKALL